MRSRDNFFRVALVAAVCTCVSLIAGCAVQTLDFSHMKQGDPSKQANLEHFNESGLSVFWLCDIINGSEATIDELVAVANSENRPVANLTVTSEERGWGCLINVVSGGIIDRGVLASLNSVTVEGDIVHP